MVWSEGCRGVMDDDPGSEGRHLREVWEQKRLAASVRISTTLDRTNRMSLD